MFLLLVSVERSSTKLQFLMFKKILKDFINKSFKNINPEIGLILKLVINKRFLIINILSILRFTNFKFSSIKKTKTILI